jgi:hypothetical protein
MNGVLRLATHSPHRGKSAAKDQRPATASDDSEGKNFSRVSGVKCSRSSNMHLPLSGSIGPSSNATLDVLSCHPILTGIPGFGGTLRFSKLKIDRLIRVFLSEIRSHTGIAQRVQDHRSNNDESNGN